MYPRELHHAHLRRFPNAAYYIGDLRLVNVTLYLLPVVAAQTPPQIILNNPRARAVHAELLYIYIRIYIYMLYVYIRIARD